MPNQRPGHVASATRFCLSCAATIACWALWIILSLTLAAQIWIALAHELPVPTFVTRTIDTRLADANLAATFTRAQFDPTGKILLEGIRLRSRQFDDPLLTGRTLYVRKGIWAYLSGQRAPEEIRLDGGTLQLPALLSPSGTAEPVLREICATLRLEQNLLHLDQLNFRAGNLLVTARGDIQLPPRTGTPPDPAKIIGEALRYGQRLVRELPQLEQLEHPHLSATIEFRPGVGHVAALDLTADAVRATGDWPLVATAFHARSTLRLDGADARPLRIRFHADRATVRDHIVIEQPRGLVTTEITPLAPTRPHAAVVRFAADRIAAYDEQVEQPVLQLNWAQDQPLRANLALRAHQVAFALATEIDLAHATAQLHFDGRVPPSLVDAVLPVRTPKLAPYFVFGDPVAVHADVRFNEGWKFETLQSRVRVQRLDSRGVKVTHARGRIDVDREGNFLAYDALARIGENYGRGSYFMNFRTWDYRFLLSGALHPESISGWFRSDWWPKFWETNFGFASAPPRADVDVLGNWHNVTKVAYYGSTDAVDAQVLGADFERAHAIVFLRPQFVHAFDLRVERAGGAQRASGWFKRFADPATREQRRLEFDLAGNLEPATLHHLGKETADTLLKPWIFSRPADVHFWGATDFANGRSSPELRFTGSANGGLRYEGFPLDSIEAEGGASGTEVRLDRILIGVAGGRGTAKASYSGAADGRKLGFDFYIENADMVRAIRAMHEYEATRGSTDANTSPNKELLKRASGGKLQFAISAQGNPDDLKSFIGSGNVQLAGAELGEVHLFGLLSQVLSSLSLNFSSLKLDTLRASYKLANGLVTVPDVRVTGPTALIEGKGDYRLSDRTLNFTAKFKPYEENRNPLTFVVGMVVNPLASILDLRLTGPIQKPSWSVTILGAGGTGRAPEKPAAPPPVPEKKPEPEAKSTGGR
ncbi:MAG: hypothetical protein KF715_06490 [Candidatus Didemnitutus sp.]|nr:hypothetical protein [Candidatus Didemnitutus sp.]